MRTQRNIETQEHGNTEEHKIIETQRNRETLRNISHCKQMFFEFIEGLMYFSFFLNV